MAVAALVWLIVAIIAFLLPISYPVTYSSMNWTPVALGGALLAIFLTWVLYARKHCHGPVTDIQNSDIVRVKPWVSSLHGMDALQHFLLRCLDLIGTST